MTQNCLADFARKVGQGAKGGACIGGVWNGQILCPEISFQGLTFPVNALFQWPKGPTKPKIRANSTKKFSE